MAKRTKSTSEKHAELKSLGKDSRDKLWKRLQLTEEILRDHEYVDANFGSEARLIEVLESDEWSEFASRPGLPALLRIFRAHPDKRVWETYKYDWVAIAELDKEDRGPTSTRTNWKAEYEKMALRVKELESELRVVREELASSKELVEKALAR